MKINVDSFSTTSSHYFWCVGRWGSEPNKNTKFILNLLMISYIVYNFFNKMPRPIRLYATTQAAS